MTRRRAFAAFAFCMLSIVPLAAPTAPRGIAQILPTTTTTQPPTSSTTRPRPSTTATTVATSTTRRSSTTTSSTSTTITTIAPPTSLVEEEEAPPAAVEDQGTLPRVFAGLSLLGFAVAFGMMGTRLYQTRREDEQLAARARERAREILSRRALRRSSRRPPP